MLFGRFKKFDVIFVLPCPFVVITPTSAFVVNWIYALALVMLDFITK